MSSNAQIAANRRNARRSTGPRTADGKARVAPNAVRHGLTSRIITGTPAAGRVAQLVKLFAGEAAPGTPIHTAARAAAEAQYIVEQVCLQRRMLFDRTPPKLRPYRPPSLMKAVDNLKRLTLSAGDELLGPMKQFNLTSIARIEASEPTWQPETDLDREALVFQEIAPTLERLARYESRAISRRNRALREIERLRAQSDPPQT